MGNANLIKETFLANCPSDKTFWISGGATCKNIYELADNIAHVNDYVFNYHVNKDHKKNDFADWIRYVLGDNILAERLHAIRTKDLYVEVIRERISEVEHMN